MKFKSAWDRLMFPRRIKKLHEKTAEEYIETLERSVKFWKEEAFRQSNKYWELWEESRK